MIEVEGYKAFHGKMLITPINKEEFKPFEITGDWLYKPEYNCWYNDGRSYIAEVCKVIEEN